MLAGWRLSWSSWLRKLVEPGEACGDEWSEQCVRGALEPGLAGAAGDPARDGEQPEAELFGFLDAGVGAGQGQHLHPGVQFSRAHGDRDPEVM